MDTFSYQEDMVTMPDKAWKAFERRIAKSLGTHRTPLSGGASRHTTSDTLHPDLYVECKQRKTSLLHGLFIPIRHQARAEHKTPVLAYHRKGSPNTLAIIDWGFFLRLWDAYQQLPRQLLEGLVAQGDRKKE